MSMFLPEGPNQTTPPSGVAAVTPADPETTQADIALMQRILSAASRNVNLIPSDFMAYIVDFIQTSRLQIPIGQVPGFAQFTANIAELAAHESTTSGTYTDLATVGPSVSALSDGKYVVLFGCWVAASTSGDAAYMSVSIDGAGASDTEAIIMPMNSVFQSGARAFATTLSGGGGHSLVAKYRCSLATHVADFQNRWLIALRYANL